MLEGIKGQVDKIINKVIKSKIGGDYVGHDKVINIYPEYREDKFENLTPTADAKPVWYFTGREGELDSLRKGIDRGEKAVLVSGMGGIGKTQICRRLYQEYLSQNGKGIFSHIGYFTYDIDLGAALVNGMEIKESSDAEENKNTAWKKLSDLSRTGKLLLFVDNFNRSLQDDPDIERLCKLQGALVISSRRNYLSDYLKPYMIGFLSMEECREIYEKIQEKGGRGVREEEAGNLSYIIETLVGFHTKTIEFLSFLARRKKWDVATLKQELEQNSFCLQFRKDDEMVNIQKSYEVLYNLFELSEPEKNVLEAFSVFPYQPLPLETLNRWLLTDAGAEEEDDIIEELYQKGWLEFFGELGSYAMHPVFAKFIYDKCRPKAEAHMGMIKECQSSLEIPEDGCAFECLRYLPFAIELLRKTDIEKYEIQERFAACVAKLFRYIGEYQNAVVILEKNIKLYEKELGKDHLDTAASYNNLAGVYESQGRYEEAEGLYKKAMKIREELLGQRDTNTAESYNNLAGVYASQVRYEEAEGLYKKAIRICEKLLGERHLDTAASYNNLAGVYESQGRYEEAKDLYKRAMKISEELLGERHPETAKSYNNLAGAYASQGRYEEAEGLYKKAMKIREKLLGERHPDTATSYNNLAGVYASQGRYEKAKGLNKKAIKIREELLGERHPDTATSYNNLAYVYESQGRYEEAEGLYKKALKIREELLGERHPDTATSYNNLAYVYESQGRYEEAEGLCKKAMKIREELLGEGHPDTATSYNDLAILYASQGRYEEAEGLYKKAMKIREELLGERHPDTATSYNNLAYVYESQGRYEEAEGLCKKAMKIREELLGEGHPDTATSYNDLAILYASQGRYEEAEVLFQKVPGDQ